jgi:hypothetical protein
MATTTTTSPRSTKAGAKTAKAKKPARKAARRTTTQSKATTAKAARTRAIHQSESAAKQAQTAASETVGVFGDYAERALLIPVGVALTARDKVVSGVNDTISSYSSTSKAQAQLRRFERRGATARNRLERELRQRRREIEKTVSELEGRRDSVAKSSSDLANRVQERVLSLV